MLNNITIIPDKEISLMKQAVRISAALFQKRKDLLLFYQVQKKKTGNLLKFVLAVTLTIEVEGREVLGKNDALQRNL